jgi:hypothetical protein
MFLSILRSSAEKYSEVIDLLVYVIYYFVSGKENGSSYRARHLLYVSCFYVMSVFVELGAVGNARFVSFLGDVEVIPKLNLINHYSLKTY